MDGKIDEGRFLFLLPLTSLFFLPLLHHSLSFHSLHLSSTPPLQPTNTNALLLHTTWVFIFLFSSSSSFSFSFYHLYYVYTFSVRVASSNTTTLTQTLRDQGGGCDVFQGRWVRDELTRPLYEESDCPYIQPQLTCQEHGRPEKEYQRWRWQPHGCDLPT